jgi:hypothetical protein
MNHINDNSSGWNNQNYLFKNSFESHFSLTLFMVSIGKIQLKDINWNISIGTFQSVHFNWHISIGIFQLAHFNW